MPVNSCRLPPDVLMPTGPPIYSDLAAATSAAGFDSPNIHKALFSRPLFSMTGCAGGISRSAGVLVGRSVNPVQPVANTW